MSLGGVWRESGASLGGEWGLGVWGLEGLEGFQGLAVLRVQGLGVATAARMFGVKGLGLGFWGFGGLGFRKDNCQALRTGCY